MHQYSVIQPPRPLLLSLDSVDTLVSSPPENAGKKLKSKVVRFYEIII